jgi:antitoxin MazE
MIVSKIGDDLAVRLSADDVARLGVKEGDAVEITRAAPLMSPESADAGPTEVSNLSPEEWLIRMRRFRGMLPADFKFNRDEANER